MWVASSNLTAVFKRAVRQTGSFPAIVPHTRCLIVFPLEEKNPGNSRVPVQWFLARTLPAILVIESFITADSLVFCRVAYLLPILDRQNE